MGAIPVMSRQLDDEYEITQLIPVHEESDGQKGSHETIKKLVGDLPEQAALKMRMSVMEAIVDTIIEDEMNDTPGITEADLKQKVNLMLDKAVALNIVPAMIKDRVSPIIAEQLRRHDPRMTLLSKSCNRITDAFVRMEEDTVISKVLDESPADTGFDITEDVVKHSGDSAQIDGSVPTEVKASVRFLAISAVNSRKATAIASKRFVGPMLGDMLYKLRNHLPENFKKKYQI